MIAAYERKLERLEEAIAQNISEGESEHAAAIRDLVQTVTVSRPKQRPDAMEIEITGRLNVLLGENAFPNNAFPNRIGRVVGSGGALPPFPTPAKCALLSAILRMIPVISD